MPLSLQETQLLFESQLLFEEYSTQMAAAVGCVSDGKEADYKELVIVWEQSLFFLT